MIVGVPRESYPGERRVALVPSVLSNLKKAGLDVVVEQNAGLEAGYPDAEYTAKGAKVVPDRAWAFRAADIIVQVLCYGSNDKTGKADVPLYRPDQLLIGFLRPLGQLDTVQDIARTGVVSFAVELMPRVTRAQSMDALSSMGTVCGQHAATAFSHDDHRRRNDYACACACNRRGCCGPAGDCDGSTARCGHFGVRFTSRCEGTGTEPWRGIRRVAHRTADRAGRRRLRPGERRILLQSPARATYPRRSRER